MIRHALIYRGEGIIESGLAFDDKWSDILRELVTEGLNDEEVTTLFRQREVWTEVAHGMKAKGSPSEVIILHLLSLKGSSADVEIALRAVGMPPIDGLRAGSQGIRAHFRLRHCRLS